MVALIRAPLKRFALPPEMGHALRTDKTGHTRETGTKHEACPAPEGPPHAGPQAVPNVTIANLYNFPIRTIHHWRQIQEPLATIIFVRGLPGVGKTTFAQTCFPERVLLKRTSLPTTLASVRLRIAMPTVGGRSRPISRRRPQGRLSAIPVQSIGS